MKHSLINQKRTFYFFASLCLCIFLVSCATHRRSALSRRLFVKTGDKIAQNFKKTEREENRRTDFYARKTNTAVEVNEMIDKAPMGRTDLENKSENQEKVDFEVEQEQVYANAKIIKDNSKLKHQKEKVKKDKPKSEKFRSVAFWLMLSSILLAGLAIILFFVCWLSVAAKVLVIVAFSASLIALILSIKTFKLIKRETKDKDIKHKFYRKTIPITIFTALFCFGMLFCLLVFLIY